MYFLPKANPLNEEISTNKVNLPGILEKLGKGHFTGYLSHTAAGFESYCIFAEGKLICAVSSTGEEEKTGIEAITLMFDSVVRTGGDLNVYRMTADLAMCAQALLRGTRVLNGDEVRQIDIKSLLARIKGEGMNGVVRFYTDERSALLFYKAGVPIGFYHDAMRTIETSPDEARKIAALPGARIEVRSTKPVQELMLHDLLKLVNLQKQWEAAEARRSSPRSTIAAPPEKETWPAGELQPRNMTAAAQADEKLTELVEDLQEVAMAYLYKEGRLLIKRCIEAAGGNSALLDKQKSEAILRQIEEQAMVIDSHARIEEMVDLMRSEIAGRLAA